MINFLLSWAVKNFTKSVIKKATASLLDKKLIGSVVKGVIKTANVVKTVDSYLNINKLIKKVVIDSFNIKIPNLKSISGIYDLINRNNVVREAIKNSNLNNKNTLLSRVNAIEKAQTDLADAIKNLNKKGVDFNTKSSHFVDKNGKLISVDNFIKNSYKELLDGNGGEVVNTYNNLAKRLTAIAEETDKVNSLVKKNASWDLGDISKSAQSAAKDTRNWIKDLKNGAVSSDANFVSLNQRIKNRVDLGYDAEELLGYEKTEDGWENVSQDYLEYKEFENNFDDDSDVYRWNPYNESGEWGDDLLKDLGNQYGIDIEKNPSDGEVIENIDVVVPDDIEGKLQLKEGLEKMLEGVRSGKITERLSNRFSNQSLENWLESGLDTLNKMLAKGK